MLIKHRKGGMTLSIEEIKQRYNNLAESSCCLSCGGAIHFTQVKSGDICVDLGSGRGTDVLRLAEKVGPKGWVYGIDISEGMIEKAKQTAEKLGISNVSFLQSHLTDIPVSNESVDWVISNCTINHVEDKSKVWKEIFRILKKGGRFVVSDIYSLQSVPIQFKLDPQAVAECWAGAVPKIEYIRTIIQSGFSDIELIEESQPYQKGEIEVASFTIAGRKHNPSACQCCR